jgi:hypothetical protein
MILKLNNNNMKTHLLNALAALLLLLSPAVVSAQVPTLGTAADFVLFTTDGAVLNQNALSLITGNVGTNNGSSTGFSNVNGVMHTADGASAQCKTDLELANGQLNSAVVTISPNHGPSLGAPGVGETLVEGVYEIPSASNLTDVLNLSGNSSSVFIFKIGGAFSTAVNSEVNLIGGVTACNVFWQVNGLVSMATGTKMKGTVIATNFAINMTGVTLEGRALAIIGAITVDGVVAKTPIGCGSPNPTATLNGPAAPVLGSTECYALFSSAGDVTNTNTAALFTGDIGTNVGVATGFILSNVTGTVHLIPDVSTGICKNDLLTVYDYLNGLVYDIELLYPVQLGNDLVLTPHTYILKSATSLTGNLYLDAQNNANAVFVIQVNGALTTSSGAQVILVNGAQAKNVYWKVSDGLVNIETNSVFIGTIVANAGAIGFKSGVILEGRALTIAGAVATAAISAIMPPGCTSTGIRSYNDGNPNKEVTVYPNPSSGSVTFRMNDASRINYYELRIYNVRGAEVMTTKITEQSTTLKTGSLPSGIYLYKIFGNNKLIKSGKLVSKQ